MHGTAVNITGRTLCNNTVNYTTKSALY